VGSGGDDEGDLLKGMVRVGDLANGLLLRESRDVRVVLMCRKAPTKALYETVLSGLAEKLKEVAPEKSYEVEGLVAQSGILVNLCHAA
jgi:perinuclear RNA-binding protein